MIDFKTEKEPKMNMFHFGAFQEKMHMLSRAKYLLQRLFGAFQDTPRNRLKNHTVSGDFPVLMAWKKLQRGHPRSSARPWFETRSNPWTELVELNSAFSTILPYVLSEKLKVEFQDVDGAALNASAIVAENYLMESTPQVDLRVVQPIKIQLQSPTRY